MTAPICKCGVDHVAVKADPAAFSRLPFVGIQRGMGAPLCLRNCRCLSTLSVALKARAWCLECGGDGYPIHHDGEHDVTGKCAACEGTGLDLDSRATETESEAA